MLHFLFLISVLCAERNSFITAASRGGMSYEDLENINFFCYPKDSCAENRTEVYNVGLEFFTALPDNYSCSCDRMCSRLGTCCKDSPYRHTPPPAVMPSCRRVTPPRGIYMVDKCEVGGDYSPIWREWCEEEVEWKEDVRMIAPVTSLSTSITYKNYYCLRCHETTNAFLYWDVKLSIFYEPYVVLFGGGIPNAEVTYDQNTKTWNAVGADGRTFDAQMEFQAPKSIRSSAVFCDAKIISDCSDSWVDEGVRNLCSAYMAVVYLWSNVYKNVHCALCNFESVEHLQCESRIGGGGRYRPSLDCVFNLNANKTGCGQGTDAKLSADKDTVRVEVCIIKDYVIKNGQCVPPQQTPP